METTTIPLDFEATLKALTDAYTNTPPLVKEVTITPITLEPPQPTYQPKHGDIVRYQDKIGVIQETGVLGFVLITKDSYSAVPATGLSLIGSIPNKMDPDVFVQRYLSGTHSETQKGRGVLIAPKLFREFSNSGLTVKTFRAKCLTTLPLWDKFPIMARPCPVKPRHGFVDSRVVSNHGELQALAKETLKADPHGEILLMPFIESEYSAIVTNSAVTIGAKNNGATSGEHSVTLPCQSDLVCTLPDRIIVKNQYANVSKYLGLRQDNQLFVETVGNNIVQLRTGPKGDLGQTRYSTKSYVTAATVFTVNPKTDFLKYEKRLDALAKKYTSDPASVIAYVPHGGLSCHYAIQAITKGFSVVCGPSKPTKGDWIRFDSNATPLSSSSVLIAAHKGIKHSQIIPINSDSLEWAVACIQGFAGVRQTVHTIQLLTTAGIILAKAGTAICFGEHRHYNRQGAGRLGLTATAEIGSAFIKPWEYYCHESNRNMLYKAVWKDDWTNSETYSKYIGLLTRVKYDFGTDWRGGFGGKAWQDCTDKAIEVLLSVQRLLHVVRARSSDQIQPCLLKLIAAANGLIHISHNCDKCLTKIVTSNKLTAITNGAAGLVIATQPFTWEGINFNDTSNDAE